ncbi:MAG: hypothetical protein CSB44_12295 [Gammaproteobacteria bacterium]|nr:MAG: hypothetical protein CSB44_12295 [Gammaproteobacteria bacterium]
MHIAIRCSVLISAVTVIQHPRGWGWFWYDNIWNFKAFMDQFVFFALLTSCIRDREMAKRMVFYMMIGIVLVAFHGIPELFEKAGRSSIEKSRLDGPHVQSNNYGGFLAYTLLPMASVFMVYMRDWRVWLLGPYFLVALKLLLATFSRGAYLAMAVGGLVAAWYRGKGFLAFWTVVALSFFLAFPSAIPDSITDRMASLAGDEARGNEEAIDKSANTRLIMWEAAAEMMQESPVMGKGFKGFPLLKDQYVDQPVEESDPHSMYFMLGAEMGVPGLLIFLAILAHCFFMGRRLALHGQDPFERTIGIAGAAIAVCFAVVCIFGSRAVSLNVTVYFWTWFVVMQVLLRKPGMKVPDLVPVRAKAAAGRPRRRPQGKGYAVLVRKVDDEGLPETAVESTEGGRHRKPRRPRKPLRTRKRLRGAQPPATTLPSSRTRQAPVDGAADEDGVSELQRRTRAAVDRAGARQRLRQNRGV